MKISEMLVTTEKWKNVLLKVILRVSKVIPTSRKLVALICTVNLMSSHPTELETGGFAVIRIIDVPNEGLNPPRHFSIEILS